MKIYKTQEAFETEIKYGKFFSKESIDISAFDLDVKVDIEVRGDIKARNITAGGIYAYEIRAGNIKAKNISALDIWALDIETGDIKARDIKAWDIRANNINAGNIIADDIHAWNIYSSDIKANCIIANDINAEDINAESIYARDVTYYAVAFAHKNIKVKSIRGKAENAKHFVLDGKLEIEDEKNKIVKPYSTKKIWICPSCDVPYKERKILDICSRCGSVIL
jgi:hypothetical protein